MRLLTRVFCCLAILLAGTASFAHDESIKMALYQDPAIMRIRGVISVDRASQGTGMLIEHEGRRYILTNNHVVQNAMKVWVDHPKTRIPLAVDMIGRDLILDLALLSVPPEFASVPTIRFGNPAEVAAGDEVYAIGYPYGSRSITIGFINSHELMHEVFILTQAPLNHGNSGGALFNSRHEVVGVNAAFQRDANLFGYAVPADYVVRILPRLIDEKIVRHGSPHVRVANSWDLLPIFFESNGLPYPPSRFGVMVVGFDDAVAKQSGLRVGDVITHLDGKDIASARDIIREMIFEYRDGDQAVFTVARYSETHHVTLTFRDPVIVEPKKR